MTPAARTIYVAPTSTTGPQSERNRLQNFLQGVRRWIAMAKAPTTTPRIVQYLTYSGLAITILAAAISYGKSADKIEQASQASKQVPVIQTTVSQLNDQMGEIKEMIKTQGDAATKERAEANKQVEALRQSQVLITNKVDTLSSQYGSMWALTQSNTNQLNQMKGSLDAMQRLQGQQKDK